MNKPEKNAKKLKLTKRQTDIALLVIQDLFDVEIAEKCGITKNCVRFHLKNIYKKVSVRTRVGLAVKILGG